MQVRVLHLVMQTFIYIHERCLPHLQYTNFTGFMKHVHNILDITYGKQYSIVSIKILLTSSLINISLKIIDLL